MILITGAIRARQDTMDELVSLSLAHVRRSRAEPGCLSHAVHRDLEDPLRLVFVEQWADREAVAAHFAVPASREFVRVAATLADGRPEITLYDAQPIRP